MEALIMEKKIELIKRLLHAIDEYYSATRIGMPMKILSRRFGKAMAPIGGFNSIVDELRIEGSIDVALNAKTGGKQVYPSGQCVKLTTDFVLLK